MEDIYPLDFPIRKRTDFKFLVIQDPYKQVSLQAYFDYFSRLAVINSIIHKNSGDIYDGTVIVELRQVPNHLDRDMFIGKHTIEGKSVQANFKIEFSTFVPRLPNKITKLQAKALSLGSFKSPNEFIEFWKVTSNVKFHIRYASRAVDIFFNHLDLEYRLTYRFKETEGDMIVERQGSSVFFTIQLRHPARISMFDNSKFIITERGLEATGWERVTAVPLSTDLSPELERTTPLTPGSKPGYLNLTQWTALRLHFEPTSLLEFESNLAKAAAYNLVPQNGNQLPSFLRVISPNKLDAPICYLDRVTLGLDFDTLYSLESAISYNFLNVYNLDRTFYQALKALECSAVREYLEMVVVRKIKLWDPLADLSDQQKRLGAIHKVPPRCFLVNKVIITPTSVFIEPRSLEVGNRVLRHFQDHIDRFMRVQFLDDGFNRVCAVRKPGDRMNEALYVRIRKLLDQGVQIGDRHYEFLAYSSSQLREHGCWFFASGKDLTAEMIRCWMGDFSREKVVPKYAARMGQCFSSSVAICSFRADEVETIPDVKRNGYIFSDGVGKMSLALAKKTRHQMNLNVDPSALQVRLGGSKGVLAVDPNLPKGVHVQLRPSQIKFDSDHLELEVVKVATYRKGYLNRQIIILMSALGVSDDYVLELVYTMLQDTKKILTDPLEALYALSPRSDDFGTSNMLVNAIQAGFLKSGDPYIQNILVLFRCSLLKELKKKAKVLVPKSACLIGVVDETGLLESDEVFVHVWDNSAMGNTNQVITGRVSIFRNPSLHPGDLRVLRAVDIPELHHLKNVVVFSSKGERDVPSMCSGGDLDGDEYTVIWDQNLLPTLIYSPMNYHAEEPENVERVELDHLKDSFVKYVRHDSLGQIANTYLANADLYGPMDIRCIELAQLHSRAVDFAKTGRYAVMHQNLMVNSYPDFMQKKDRVPYPSKKILGQIFRLIDAQSYKNYVSCLIQEGSAYDSQFYIKGMVSYINKARELRGHYDVKLAALINHYGVKTEAELLTGYVVKWEKKGKGKTVYKQHDNMLKSVRQLKNEWIDEFEREFIGKHKKIDLSKGNEIYAKAAAWYYVTYHPDERKEYGLEYFSFPWTIYKYICRIKQDSDGQLNALEKHVANLKI